MEKEVESILEGVKPELLTEDVKKKFSVLIEAKVGEKVNEKIEELESKFEEFKEVELDKLEEQAVGYVDTHLVDQLDKYLDYVAETYVTENALEIENGLKSEMYDKIVEDFRGVFAKNQIRENEVEDAEEIHEDNQNLKEDLNESMKREMDLQDKITGLNSLKVFNEISEGLSESQKEKLQKLSEDFDVDDVEEFAEKVQIVKESIIDKSDDFEDLNDDDDFDVDTTEKEVELSENITIKETLEESDFEDERAYL